MTRHLAAIGIGIALLACAVTPAAAQRWLYPPGPPYRTCPDSVTLFSVQQTDTLLAPCHPATLDTVRGVRGVITGFDARPSAYGFYIQDGNGPWTGVDVFTGATNYNSAVPGTPTGGNLQLGDVVRVYGTTQEFPNPNGETEIEGPDAVQSTNDIIIHKIGTSALPTIHVGTTHEFNWVPGISATTAEPWEGCLVRINGPMHVARISGSGVAGNTFLVVSNANPSDSVLVDGFTLFLFGTPPLNSTVGFVQGILNQRASTAGTGAINSYRIQIRDANDINVDAPPNLVEAFPLEDNKLRLLFDKNLDPASAQNEGNYSLGSGISGSTVDNAVLVGGSGTTVELDITSAISPGDDESITAQSIGTATCPLCVSPSQTLDFAQGITPLYEETPGPNLRSGPFAPLVTIKGIQAPDPASLGGLCEDRSHYAGPGAASGKRITVRGTVVQQYGGLYYLVHLSGGKRRGVSVFGPTQTLVPGHKYRIACRVQEFGGETELVNTVHITDEGLAAVPAASIQTIHDLADVTCDAAQNLNTGEDWEGVLVRVNNVRVVNFDTPPEDPIPGGSFQIVPEKAFGAPDKILVSSLGGHYTYDPNGGDLLDSVTGILHQDGTFRILPRSDADIVFRTSGVHSGSGVELALEVTPNPGSAHRVRFSLPRKDEVELGVYDLLGRRLAVLASGVMESGAYDREWNGRGSDGRLAGAGMYFYRLRVGDQIRTTRAVRLD